MPALLKLHQCKHEKYDEENKGPCAWEQQTASEPTFGIASARLVCPTVTEEFVRIIVNPLLELRLVLFVCRVTAVLRGVLLLAALIFPPIEEFSLHFLDAVFDDWRWVLDLVTFLVELEFLHLDGVIWREPHVSEFLSAFLIPPLAEGLLNVFFLAYLLNGRVQGRLKVENPECCDRQKRHVMMEFEKPERF